MKNLMSGEFYFGGYYWAGIIQSIKWDRGNSKAIVDITDDLIGDWNKMTNLDPKDVEIDLFNIIHNSTYPKYSITTAEFSKQLKEVY
jgi:hypothetical protein